MLEKERHTHDNTNKNGSQCTKSAMRKTRNLS